jgi:hypothetical protein
MKLLYALFVGIICLGCTTDPQIQVIELFPKKVELISHDSANARVRVVMYVGPDGCHRFKETRSTANAGSQQVRFYAEHQLNSTCTLALVNMDETLTIRRSPSTNKLVVKLESGTDTTMIMK